MNIAVLGADTTAREIACVCALAGERVRLHADDATAVMDSIDIIERRIDDAHSAGDVSADERDSATDRLEGTTGLDAALTDADVAIETTASDDAGVQDRFAELENVLDREALISSAVPAVSVTNAAAGLRNPDRAVGFRFHQSGEPFVEVVLAEQTGSDAASLASRFAESVSSDWVTVRDTPGNLSMRLSLALEVAAIRMLDEGVADVGAVDAAFRHTYQTTVAPLERADRIGLDDRHDALLSLSHRLGPRFEPPPLLSALVEEGKTGADAGEGFYIWEDGEPQRSALPNPVKPTDDEQRHRDPTR